MKELQRRPEACRAVDFFMGTNAPDGFVSLYEELQIPIPGIRRYLVKGGPGTGKSSLMRHTAEQFASRETLLERIHCSSDPDSLDGVIFHTGGFSLVDATPPHVIEPSFPGGFETVINLCEYFEEDKLERRLEDTVALQQANSACHQKCRSLLKCVELLCSDSRRLAGACTDCAKAEALAARICRRELRAPSKTGKGREWKRLLSAVTNQGVLTYTQTVPALCRKAYLLQDDYGCASGVILRRIREEAQKQGYDQFTCWCPLAPRERLEHLFLPELGIGFLSQSRFEDFSDLQGKLPLKVIRYTRFTDLEQLRRSRQHLRFNRRAAEEMLGAAVDALRRAKRIHDDLERQYSDAVDFARVDAKAGELYRAMKARYDRVER